MYGRSTRHRLRQPDPGGQAGPEDFQDFAATFVHFQMMRHDCDYDPQERLSKAVVLQDIDTAEDALRRFAGASARERRAFVALVLFRRRL